MAPHAVLALQSITGRRAAWHSVARQSTACGVGAARRFTALHGVCTALPRVAQGYPRLRRVAHLSVLVCTALHVAARRSTPLLRTRRWRVARGSSARCCPTRPGVARRCLVFPGVAVCGTGDFSSLTRDSQDWSIAVARNDDSDKRHAHYQCFQKRNVSTDLCFINMLPKLYKHSTQYRPSIDPTSSKIRFLTHRLFGSFLASIFDQQ